MAQRIQLLFPEFLSCQSEKKEDFSRQLETDAIWLCTEVVSIVYERRKVHDRDIGWLFLWLGFFSGEGFLKLVYTESQVNYKTQPFWVKFFHLVLKVQTLAGHAVGTIYLAPTTTLHFNTVLKTKYQFIPALDFFISCKNKARNN